MMNGINCCGQNGVGSLKSAQQFDCNNSFVCVNRIRIFSKNFNLFGWIALQANPKVFIISSAQETSYELSLNFYLSCLTGCRTVGSALKNERMTPPPPAARFISAIASHLIIRLNEFGSSH